MTLVYDVFTQEIRMAHIKITIGALTLEYDGDQDFIENGLITLLNEVVEKADHAAPTPTRTEKSESTNSAAPLSTNTIAQIIGVKTGSDLALAAVARMNIVQNKPSSTRQEILDEMREATSYFKDTFVSNLSAYLETLVKNRRVNLVARQTYALTAAERARLQGLVSASEA